MPRPAPKDSPSRIGGYDPDKGRAQLTLLICGACAAVGILLLVVLP